MLYFAIYTYIYIFLNAVFMAYLILKVLADNSPLHPYCNPPPPSQCLVKTLNIVSDERLLTLKGVAMTKWCKCLPCVWLV